MRILALLAIASTSACRAAPEAGRATIYWDSYGVASIVADKLDDAEYALGYAQARDHAVRMAQMYKFARGRLAEANGRGTLPQDGLIRSLGLEDAAIKYFQTMPADEKSYLQAFCDGANRAVAEQKATLPTWIEPFTLVDVLSFAQLINIGFPLQGLSRQLGLGGPGSNQFVLAPNRTSTRHPIVSLDPHLGLDGQDLIVWQEFAIYTEGIKFRGVGIPGVPLGAAGHTDRIAWSVTNNDPAVATVYIVKPNPANAKQYSFHGEWRDFENRSLELKYLDNGKLVPFLQSVKMTAWGPMMPLSTYAVKMSPVGNFAIFKQSLLAARAKNVDDFRASLGLNGLSMWNYTVADVEGNIAYQYNAHLPKRDESIDWRKPVDGSQTNTALKDEHWSIDELPHAKNPASGVLVNANSAPWLTTMGDEIPKLWPNYVTSYGHTSRYDRLSAILGVEKRVSPERAMKIATDTLIPNAALTAIRLGVLGDGHLDCVKVMKKWDGRADVDSVGPALYLTWLLQRSRNVDLARLAGQNVVWTADQTKEAEADLVAAGEKLKAALGSVDVKWGKMMRLVRGTKEVGTGGFGYLGGNAPAVRPTTGPVEKGGWIRANFGSSTRMIVSLEPGGIRSWSVIPYGNSEVPTSPHFGDQMELYGAGKYKEDSFGVDAVKKSAKEKLTLSR